MTICLNTVSLVSFDLPWPRAFRLSLNEKGTSANNVYPNYYSGMLNPPPPPGGIGFKAGDLTRHFGSATEDLRLRIFGQIIYSNRGFRLLVIICLAFWLYNRGFETKKKIFGQIVCSNPSVVLYFQGHHFVESHCLRVENV
jgi:hypothetical protein